MSQPRCSAGFKGKAARTSERVRGVNNQQRIDECKLFARSNAHLNEYDSQNIFCSPCRALPCLFFHFAYSHHHHKMIWQQQQQQLYIQLNLGVSSSFDARASGRPARNSPNPNLIACPILPPSYQNESSDGN